MGWGSLGRSVSRISKDVYSWERSQVHWVTEAYPYLTAGVQAAAFVQPELEPIAALMEEAEPWLEGTDWGLQNLG